MRAAACSACMHASLITSPATGRCYARERTLSLYMTTSGRQLVSSHTPRRLGLAGCHAGAKIVEEVVSEANMHAPQQVTLVVTSLDVASRREQGMHARDRASSRAFSARLLRKRARSQRAPANSREVAGCFAAFSRRNREFAASSPREPENENERRENAARTQRAACDRARVRQRLLRGPSEQTCEKRASSALPGHTAFKPL